MSFQLCANPDFLDSRFGGGPKSYIPNAFLFLPQIHYFCDPNPFSVGPHPKTRYILREKKVIGPQLDMRETGFSIPTSDWPILGGVGPP